MAAHKAALPVSAVVSDVEAGEEPPHAPCLDAGARQMRSWRVYLLTAWVLILLLCDDQIVNGVALAAARLTMWHRQGRDTAPDVRRKHPVVVHQTVRSRHLSEIQRTWSESWLRLGFEVNTADDAQARLDVARLARETGHSDFLRVYDSLETSVQRSDVWRYAILWLDGGVYADIDVVAHPPVAELLHENPARPLVFTESLPLFDWLPLPLVARFGRLVMALGLTDLVRLPQRRNCVMAAPRRHPLMLRTLELIVRRFDAASGAPRLPEPARTLELTGPGAYSDAVQAQSERAGGEAGLRFVDRFEGLRYFTHVAQGSWKTYLDHAALRGAAPPPHEVMLRRVLGLGMLIGLLAYWGAPYAVKPKPREQCVQACCRSDRKRWAGLALAAAHRAWLKLGAFAPAMPAAARRRRRPSCDMSV